MSAIYLTLAQAAKLAPTRPSSNAVWRWCRRGVKARNGKRVHLEHIRVGGRVFTTAESVHKFFDVLAQADLKHFELSETASMPETPTRTDAVRMKAIRRAEAELKRAGI